MKRRCLEFRSLAPLAAASALILCCRLAVSHDCWALQESTVDVSLRGLSAVDAHTCWASGSGGTVLRTLDGGSSWQNVSPRGLAALDFRDIHAFDAVRAVILSSGEVDNLYRTDNGGATWVACYEHPDTAAFLDGMAFWDERRGIAMGDPIDGRLLILTTSDGGVTWRRQSTENAPKVIEGEAGFAASGTNLCVSGDGWVWIALGGAAEGESSRTSSVWYSQDYGNSWKRSEVPMKRTASRGIFSVAASSPRTLVAVGGDYLLADERTSLAAFSDNGGQEWHVPRHSVPNGYRSVVVFIPQTEPAIWLAAGPNGTDESRDHGNSWQSVSKQSFHTISFARDGSGWAAGAEGRIAKYQRH